MSDLKTADRPHRRDKGFTLIELLVVVTIIGILAAIVSVSVTGFTGKASVQAHKTAIQSVQAAVDAYIADHYDGSGAVAPPTSAGDTSIAGNVITEWYGTDGVVRPIPAQATWTVLKLVNIQQLKSSTTTVLANTTRTLGPYLRLGGNTAIQCVYKDTAYAAIGPSSPDGSWQVVFCRDTAQ